MATVAELSIDEETGPLKEIAAHKGWEFERLDDLRFSLGLPARDGTMFWLLCDCDRYPSVPPAWHWYNPKTEMRDQPKDTPKGGTFFHQQSKVICAPWNRLTYKSENPHGPHSDWAIGDWRANPRTGACKTLPAMALRIAVELRAPAYEGRGG